MRKFDVRYTGVISIEADTVQEANLKFRAMFQGTPTFSQIPESFTQVDDGFVGETTEVVGTCEMTGLAIFEDDEYYIDEDEIMVLENTEAIEKKLTALRKNSLCTPRSN